MQAQKKVAGIHYPADRAKLIEYARQHGADKELLDCLRRLPDRIYHEQNEVGRAFAQATGL
jgi:hypothetical protein